MIGSHVASTSSTSTFKWEYNFQLGDKVLPTDSYTRTWRNGLRGQVSDSLGKALLLPANLEHYADFQDEDIVLKLRWHTVAMSICIPHLLSFLYYYAFTFSNFYTNFISVNTRITLTFPFLSLLPSQATQLTHVVEGRLKGMMEEANKKKALKQVVEANLNEKTQELNAIECQATMVERALELAKQKAEAEVSNIVST